MLIRQIKFASDDFARECQLRHRVLREPLGLSLFDEDLNIESEQFHFGMFDSSGNLLACVIAVMLSPVDAKIRQMAVDPAHQGKGYGRQIILHLEEAISRLGVTHFSLSARLTAIIFYEKLGYMRVGEIFTEVGIPHINMEKFFPKENH